MVKAQKTVVVAAGRYKTGVAGGAPRRLFNVLITDELAAKRLLGGD